MPSELRKQNNATPLVCPLMTNMIEDVAYIVLKSGLDGQTIRWFAKVQICMSIGPTDFEIYNIDTSVSSPLINFA